jgi:hypothetical protein
VEPRVSEPTVVVFRPRRLRVLAVVMSVALCGIAIGGWFALPLSLRSQFTVSQLVTLLAFLAVLELIVISMAASYVRADVDGLRFRNGLRSHAVPWAQVHKIMLRPGDPWAMLLLQPSDGSPFEVDLDAEKRQLMGIQANDGATAQQAVEELRRRIRHSRS